jgi:hypothetical protein
MAEFIRRITVHVEVDTNKETYTLDIDDDYAADEVPHVVREFIERCAS